MFFDEYAYCSPLVSEILAEEYSSLASSSRRREDLKRIQTVREEPYRCR